MIFRLRAPVFFSFGVGRWNGVSFFYLILSVRGAKGRAWLADLASISQGALYHVISRGNQKQTVFRDAEDYRRFGRLLEDVKGRH